jgi:ELWxxDGT repeat protein
MKMHSGVAFALVGKPCLLMETSLRTLQANLCMLLRFPALLTTVLQVVMHRRSVGAEERRMKFTTAMCMILVAVLFCIATTAHAANPYLVKDINTLSVVQSSDPKYFTAVNSKVFFTADDAVHGTELWVTDGTEPGTVLVKDINPGVERSLPFGLVSFDNKLFFWADDGVSGVSLWQSDGSDAGTTLVKSFNPATEGYANNSLWINTLVVVNNVLYFVTSDQTNNLMLWRSDGTTTGTTIVTTINMVNLISSFTDANGNLVSSLTDVNGTLYFSAGDQAHGYGLWRSDGTGAGTEQLSSVAASNLANVNGKLFFRGTDSANGAELWVSDGTLAGTVMVKDINPGTAGSNPSYLTNVNGKLFFNASDGVYGYELWVSDGTALGTVMVTDINLGAAGSYPSYLTNINGTLHFSADNANVNGIPSNNYELWKSDGTASGTVMVKKIRTGSLGSLPKNLTNVNGTLLFNAFDDSQRDNLWRSDGTSVGTVMIKSVDGSNLTSINGALYFSATDGVHGVEFWRSYGTASDTFMIKDINKNSSADSWPFGFTDVNGTLYFAAKDASHGVELWKTNGSESGTTLVKDINPSGDGSFPNGFTSANGILFFAAADGVNNIVNGTIGHSLWKTDGTAAGTVVVKATPLQVGNLFELNGKLVFIGYDGVYQLWSSDGTDAGTAPICSGVACGTHPTDMVAINGMLFYWATNASYENVIWKTDGTAAGTSIVKNFGSSLLDGSVLGNFVNVNGKLFFMYDDGIHGLELWISDGTAVGTVPVMDINPGIGASLPLKPLFTPVGNTLYFIANDGVHGSELWRSDGTAVGTKMVKDINVGAGDSAPTFLKQMNGTLYFSAADGINGYQLWSSDGTEVGTTMVKDVAATELIVVGNELYFTTSSATLPPLWKSDGTTAGTVPVSYDPYPRNISELTAMGNLIFFSGRDASHGVELFAYSRVISILDNSQFTTSLSVPLTIGCPLPTSCVQMNFSNNGVFDTGAWETYSTSKIWNLTAGDGSKTVCVKFKDAQGVESHVFCDKVILDTVLPDVSLTSFPAVQTTSTSASFSFSSSDPTATFQCWVDFDPVGYQTCTSSVSYILYQGSHIFRVRAVDPAGNIGTAAIHEWTVIDNLGGSAFGWGANQYGQLGIGAKDYNAHPLFQQVEGPVGFVQIAAGAYHTVALRNDGTVWAWGYGGYLGLGQNHPDSYVPVQVQNLSDVQAIAASTAYTLALKKDGTVWIWGSFPLNYNYFGTPQQVLGIDQVSAISAATYHAIALRQDGTVWVWGRDTYGELGLGRAGFEQMYPTIVSGLSGITAISAGHNHSLAIQGIDGSVLAWGRNDAGYGYPVLGVGAVTSNILVPTPVVQPNVPFIATKIAAGHNVSVAVDDSGNYWGWGLNSTGLLGIGTYGSVVEVPTKGSIPGKKVTDVAIKSGLIDSVNTMFLAENGTVWMAGLNNMGQMGRGIYDSDVHSIPEKVAYLSGVFNISLSSDEYQAFALRKTWILSALDSINNSSQTSSITADRNNNLHLAYGSYTDLMYSTNTSGTWEKASIGKWPGTYVTSQQIAVDSLGKVHICAVATAADRKLYYVTNSGGTFVSYPVDSSLVGSCSIAIKNDSTIYISYGLRYIGQSLADLRLASITNNGTAISTTLIENGSTSGGINGGNSSIAVDASGQIHIGYTQTRSGNNISVLKYVTGSSPSTFGTPVEIDSSAEGWPSLAISKTGGFPGISYAKRLPSYQYSLNYAKYNGVAWSTETVDSTEKMIGYNGTSLTYINDTPYMSYYDDVNFDLKVAYWDGSRWVRTAVDTDGDVGQNSSITSDSINALHVSYSDRTNVPRYGVRYATNVDASRPNGNILINNNSQYTNNANVTLNLACSDSFGIGCWQVVLSTDGNFNIQQAIPFTSIKQFSLPSGDGTKAVYVRFEDGANNWSGVYSTSIFLDTVKPTGTLGIVSSNGFSKDLLVRLTTSCTDPGGAAASGCSTMKFSTDGSTYSTALPYATESSIFVPAGDGLKDVYVIYTDKAGNDSLPIHATVTLDSTAPTTSADFPGGSYSTAQTVTLSCDDHAGGSGCLWTKYTLDGTDPTTSNTALFYSGPLTINKELYLAYYSVDKLGNAEGLVTQHYTFVQGYTKLSMELSKPTIAFNGNVNVFGRLQNLSNPANNADPTGEKITITITDPDGIATSLDTLIVNNQGQYLQLLDKRVNGTQLFDKKGAYLISAKFSGSSLLSPTANNEIPSLPLMVGASAGYAILIEGKLNSSEGIASHNKTANRIYQKLKTRGFVDDNIYYFNYDTTQTGVDATPSKTEIQFAIQAWARDRMNGLPAPLYIIMVDHGGNNAFYIDSETITPTTAVNAHTGLPEPGLAEWLTTLEASLNAAAIQEKRVVIIGSCFSGSFISALSKSGAATGKANAAGRVIITSAAANEVSYKGPLESDTIRSGEYFLEELFTQLERGQTIRQSFIEATTLTRIYTQQGGGSTNSNAPYYDGAVQHPMIDDNGDGIGSNSLSNDTTQDGASVASMVLGANVGSSTNSALNPVEIVKVTDTVILETTQNSASLWATVNDVTQVDSSVWVEIRNTSQALTTTTGTEQASLNTTKIAMKYESARSRYEVDIPNPYTSPDIFTDPGKYDIFYFVRDVVTHKLAPMKRSSVYHKRVGNPAPTAPDMTNAEPQHGTHQSTSIHFSWGKVVDADPPVSYSLFISANSTPDYGNATYVLENIAVNHALVGPEAGLEFNKNYFWKVRAIDRYGAYSDSTIVPFDTVFDTNADVVMLSGTVLDSSTFQPVRAGIDVNLAGNSTKIVAVADVDGSYFFPNLGTAGTYTVATSATGYTTVSKDIVITSQGRLTIFTHDVNLAKDTASQTHAVNVTVNGINGGSGSVSSTPGGISCQSGSSVGCSYSFANLQQVTLSWPHIVGSLFSGWSGDCSGTGPCSFTDMTANRNVTATFVKTPPFKRPSAGGYAYDLQSTYNDPLNTDPIIQMQETIPAGAFTAAINKAVTLDGGYDADFTPGPSGTFTTIQGKLTVQNGTLRVQRVKVK